MEEEAVEAAFIDSCSLISLAESITQSQAENVDSIVILCLCFWSIYLFTLGSAAAATFVQLAYPVSSQIK